LLSSTGTSKYRPHESALRLAQNQPGGSANIQQSRHGGCKFFFFPRKIMRRFGFSGAEPRRSPDHAIDRIAVQAKEIVAFERKARDFAAVFRKGK
jgi:hypothetical protein